MRCLESSSSRVHAISRWCKNLACHSHFSPADVSAAIDRTPADDGRLPRPALWASPPVACSDPTVSSSESIIGLPTRGSNWVSPSPQSSAVHARQSPAHVSHSCGVSTHPELQTCRHWPAASSVPPVHTTTTTHALRTAKRVLWRKWRWFELGRRSRLCKAPRIGSSSLPTFSALAGTTCSYAVPLLSVHSLCMVMYVNCRHVRSSVYTAWTLEDHASCTWQFIIINTGAKPSASS